MSFLVSPSRTNPAGSNKQIQYNNSGTFGAEAGFEYDAATNTFSVVDMAPTGDMYVSNGKAIKATDGGASLFTFYGAGFGNQIQAGVFLFATLGLQIGRGLTLQVNTVTTDTTLDGTYYLVLVNSASNRTITLPAAVSHSGREYRIKNINTGIVTIDGNASETIDGATTYALSSQYASVDIICDGSNWHIV